VNTLYKYFHIGGYGSDYHTTNVSTMEMRFYKNMLEDRKEIVVVDDLNKKWSDADSRSPRVGINSISSIKIRSTTQLVKQIRITIKSNSLVWFEGHTSLNVGQLVRIVSELGGGGVIKTDGNDAYTLWSGNSLRFYNIDTFTGDIGPIVYTDGIGGYQSVVQSDSKPADKPFMAFPDGGFGVRLFHNPLQSLSEVGFTVSMVVKWFSYDNLMHNDVYPNGYDLVGMDRQWITLMCIGRALGLVGIVLNSSKIFVSLVGNASEKNSNYISFNPSDYSCYYKTAVCVETVRENMDNTVNITYTLRSQRYQFSDDYMTQDISITNDVNFSKDTITVYEEMGNQSYLQTFSCVCSNAALSANDPAWIAKAIVYTMKISADKLLSRI